MTVTKPHRTSCNNFLNTLLHTSIWKSQHCAARYRHLSFGSKVHFLLCGGGAERRSKHNLCVSFNHLSAGVDDGIEHDVIRRNSVLAHVPQQLQRRLGFERPGASRDRRGEALLVWTTSAVSRQGGRGQRVGYGVKRAPRAKKRLARKYKPDGLLSDGSRTFLHENDTKTIEAKKKKPRSQPSIPWAFAAHLLDQSQSLLVCTGRLGIGRGGSDRLLPSLPPSFASRAKSRVNIAARSTSCRYQSRSRLAMTAVDEKGGEAILPDGWRSKDRAPTLL